MELIKIVKKYIVEGDRVVLGSTMWRRGLISLNEPEEVPLQMYVPGRDIYPTYGPFMCYKNVRVDDFQCLKMGMEIWKIEGEVSDIRVPQLVHPKQIKDHSGLLSVFWDDPKRFCESFPNKIFKTPSQTVFCSKIRLLEKMEEPVNPGLGWVGLQEVHP